MRGPGGTTGHGQKAGGSGQRHPGAPSAPRPSGAIASERGVLVIVVHAAIVQGLSALQCSSANWASEPSAVGELVIVPWRHPARRSGEVWDLSAREFQRVRELECAPGAGAPKVLLVQRPGPLRKPMHIGAIKVRVPNPRRMVGADAIRTVRGLVYLLQA